MEQGSVHDMDIDSMSQFLFSIDENENHLSLLAFLSHDSLLAATSTTCNSNNLSNMFQQARGCAPSTAPYYCPDLEI